MGLGLGAGRRIDRGGALHHELEGLDLLARHRRADARKNFTHVALLDE